MAKTERQRAKDRANEWFSKFIRLVECLETTGDPEWGNCRTCGARKHFGELHCGHYIPGRWNSILFEREVAHIQCNQCNGKEFLNGNMVEYTPFMVGRYGQERVNQLWVVARQPVKMSVQDLRDIATKYRKLYNKLMGEYQNGTYKREKWRG